jgi:hypothetical protein
MREKLVIVKSKIRADASKITANHELLGSGGRLGNLLSPL